MRSTLLLALLLLICTISYGQLSVQNGSTAQQLGNNLAGSNITITNATISGDADQSGTFQYVGNDLGLNSGVILSTGDIFDAVGPNSNNGTSTGYNNPGDPDLTALAGFNTNDAVVFEFDFEVQGDEIAFNFVFLSEEYNEFVNSGFNDVFAFYISGPGIVGQENLAVIPGTTTPVTINTINNGSFWQFYNDNDNGAVDVEFDGFTTLMTAFRDSLIPCNTYTLSLRIADGSDDALDSGVLLQENSLVSNSISASSYTFSSDTTALEGCIDANFTFQLAAPASNDVHIPIALGGTALNGVDYTHIDSIITIPAGQTASTVIIDALADGIAEGQETVELYYKPSSCAPYDTVILYIDDATSITSQPVGTDLNCNGDASGTIDVTIGGGFPPYTVTYTDTATGISNTVAAAALPITGLDAGAYLIEVADQYGCVAEAIVSGGSFDAGQTFLPDGTGASYTSNITISGFGGGQTLNSINQINSICATMEHSYSNDLTIVLQAPNGSQVQLKNVGPTGGAINAVNMGEPVASGPVDNWSTSNLDPGIGYQYCWNNNPTYPTMNALVQAGAPGPPPQYTYTTLAGNSYTDYYLPAGSYAPTQSLTGFIGTPLDGVWTLIVTDNYALDNGYIFDWSISLQADLPDSIIVINEPPVPTFAHTSVDPSCGANDGSIDLTVTGDNPPFTYLWSTGATTEDIAGIASGAYTVSATDTTGCTYEYIVNVSNNGSVALSANLTDESCVGADDGAIDLVLTGGTPGFTYAWSNSQTVEDISGLAPGTYSVSVGDAGGCNGVASFDIMAATPIISNMSVTDEECGDREGSANLSMQGGVAPYTFLWSSGETTQNIDELQQGSYYVTVTDANGCTKEDSAIVVNLVGNCVPTCDLEITTANETNETCGNVGGAIDLVTFTTSGPITFTWSSGQTTEDISGLAAGNYSVTMVDAQGCQVSDSYLLVNQAGGLDIPSMNVTNELCGNGQGAIDATITGGAQPYTYNWSNGETTEDISGLSAGTYTLTVTDGNGCGFLNSATVNNNSGSLAQTYGNAVDEVCTNGGGSIDIIISGGSQPYTYTWSNGSNNEDLLNLSAGTYQCTISDATGCSITTPAYVINNNSGDLAFNYIDVDNEVCDNDAGEIELQVSGGSAPYSYTWATGQTTAVIDGLNSGTYEATVTDGAGCYIETGSLVVANESGTLSLDAVSAFDEVCSNATGSVNISVSGGTSPLTYAWSTGSNSEDISNLSTDNYVCTITDINGCSVTAMAFVDNDPGALAIDNVIAIDESCGDATGSVDLVISGEAAPSTYIWSNSATSQMITALSAGIYDVTVTDAQGCTVSGSSTVNNNTGTLSLDSENITNEVCGDGQGVIDLSLSGGTAPLTFLWSNAATTEDLSSLSAGTYTCTITDAANCVLIAGTYTINNSSGGMTNAGSSVSDEACGDATGAIDITVNGGTGPLTFLWSNAATTEDLSGVNAGNYTCTITDAAGCSLEITETVNNNSAGMAIASAQITDELCGDGAGAIDVTLSGGTGPFIYLWSNSANTEDISGLSQGSYTLTVTDASGCMVSTTSLQVNDNSGGFQLGAISTLDETCGDGAGEIDAQLVGGFTPISFIWSNSATTEDITGLVSGAYTATATDAAGCVVTYSASIMNDPGSLDATGIATDETCGSTNGAIDLTPANGTTPYTFAWSNGETTEDLVNVDGGTYTCIVTDAAGCATNYTATLNDFGENFQIANASINDDICDQEQGSIQVTTTGGVGPYTYTWESLTPDSCCIYYLELNDNAGNGWANQFVTIYINGISQGNFSPPGFQLTETFSVCNGDVFEIEYTTGGGGNSNWYYLMTSTDTLFDDGVTGGPSTGLVYTGTVNCPVNPTGGSSISGLSAGDYSVTITDANGCTTTNTMNVGNNTGTLQITNNGVLDEACGQADGSIDLTISGTPTIVWSNGATTEDLINLASGNYTITVEDANGCVLTESYTVLNNTGGMAVSNSAITDENCGDGQGAIDITVGGGTGPYSFAWSNGSNTEDLILLAAGNYDVTITDATGCDLFESYAVTNNANGITVGATSTDEFCDNNAGSIVLNVTGGTAPYSFAWSNGSTSQSLSFLSEGIYTCTVTDAASCLFMVSDTVNNSQGTLAIANVDIDDAFCGDEDGDINLIITGGTTPYTFLWSDASTDQDLNNVFPGDYSIIITDANGCQVMDTFTVGNDAFFSVDDTTIVNELCNDGQGSIDLTVGFGGGAPDYIWSTGATTEDIAGLSAGTYSVTIEAGFFGCLEVQTYVVLNDNGTLTLDSLNAVDESCSQSDGSLDLFVSGGTAPYSFDWSNGATTEDLAGIAAGTYDVTITDANGCESISSITISNNTFGFGIAGSMVNDEQCSDAAGSIDITVAGGLAPYSFAWSTGQTTEDLTNLSAGSYTIDITDNAGCVTTQTFTIINNTNGLASSTAITDETCDNGTGSVTLLVTGGTAPYTYNWSTGSTDQNLTGLNGGTYTCTVVDDAGCSFIITETVNNVNVPVNLTGSTITQTSCLACTNGGLNITMDPTGAPYTYLWSNGETTQDIFGLLMGSYTVTITNAAGCVTDSTFTVPSIVGVTVLDNFDFKVYPNPNDGLFHVEFTGVWPQGEVNVEVFNSLGQEVISRQYADVNDPISINLDNHYTGSYLLRVTTGDRHFVKRIIVVND